MRGGIDPSSLVVRMLILLPDPVFHAAVVDRILDAVTLNDTMV
jgi:hypothetical protein